MENVETDLKAKTATVTMKTGTLQRAAVVKALGDTKYEVSSFAPKAPAASEAKKAAPKTKKKAAPKTEAAPVAAFVVGITGMT